MENEVRRARSGVRMTIDEKHVVSASTKSIITSIALCSGNEKRVRQ